MKEDRSQYLNMRTHRNDHARLRQDPVIGMLKQHEMMEVLTVGWDMLSDEQKREAQRQVHERSVQKPAAQRVAG